MTPDSRDPRTLITPDAFHVDPALLGIPLARPIRRLWALLIDLIAIGVLTMFTGNVTLFIWGAVALFFISMAFRSPGQKLSRGTAFLFRGATGCLGVAILLGVGIGFLAVGLSEDDGDGSGGVAAAADALGLGDIARGLQGAAAVATANDTVEAREALEGVMANLQAAGLGRERLRETTNGIVESVELEGGWADHFDTVMERALNSVLAEEVAPVDDSEAASSAAAVADEVGALTDAEVVTGWAASRAADPPAEGSDEALRASLLNARMLPLVATDTLGTLARQLDRAADREERLSNDLAGAEAALADSEEGFLGLLRDIWGQLGSAIGLWSVYFTVALTVTQGRTIGKKLMGIRVLRLDGEPITWWTAFERAGGYVAGIATGLLGFVQVFWDPNRQAVHDKIMGTVVVSEGAQAIPGAWQEAWPDTDET